MTTPGQRDRAATRLREALDLRKSPRIDAETGTDERTRPPETATQRRRRATSAALTRWLLRQRANV